MNGIISKVFEFVIKLKIRIYVTSLSEGGKVLVMSMI
jgi:hypothetical protein